MGGAGATIAQDAESQTLREQLDRPVVALLNDASFRNSSSEAKSLRSTIEQNRKQQIASCEADEARMRTKLGTARKTLRELDASSNDTRSKLHVEIAALERVLRDRKRECERTIPASFEIQLAKAHLLEQWPERRLETTRTIDRGLARKRKHGDVEDIGYRAIVDDPEKDIAVGEQASRQMASSKLMPHELQDASVRKYIENLSQKIARNSDLKVPLHVTVLDSNELSSVALPGGFLFLTSELILACETESELAGLISQQVAHIAARHGTRNSKRSMISRFVVPAAQVATGIFTGGISNAGAYYGMSYGFQGMQALVDRALIQSNGKAQQEADQLGIQYSWKAGFDPKGFITFLDTISKDNGHSGAETFLMTKPALGERFLDAFTEIEFLQPNYNSIVDSEEFRKTRERLQELRTVSNSVRFDPQESFKPRDFGIQF